MKRPRGVKDKCVQKERLATIIAKTTEAGTVENPSTFLRYVR